MPTHVSKEELERALSSISGAPKSEGPIDLIVRRPANGERELLDSAELDVDAGLVGDNWKARGCKKTPDGSAHPEMQITLTGKRILDFIARDDARRELSGDQFVVDLDLSQENLPAGARLQLGEAVIEITSVPHTGCKKYVERFGIDALKLVNSPFGKNLRLRGVNAKVVQSGTVRRGQPIVKIG